ncbi:DUF5317 domain-containing protein [Pseudobacteroides cellulosolvens]|uniref:DUF5317 domain-containing protein n=1 Tax=Pseudobacteroides cellulosolvens ATCC 35603 = DSM 2933 TaxID=398512 RepID=A0A0L6JR48_9FIRM|nr:DUF5317 domain-containing protein [Pseudobacteroides cellulosolvens]KNY28248.1 hypothetical protein Bccel_3522 [Pseudobacteroides cellulosolvens ATCC 35603 = DSM 2933]
MLYLVVIVLGVVLGVLAKGRVSNILNLKFEKLWLLLIVVCIQTAIRLLALRGLIDAGRYSFVTQGAAFTLLMVVLWYNRRLFGVVVIGVGTLSNILVMMLNGGLMPVSSELLKKIGDLSGSLELMKNGSDGKHILINEATKLPLLSDIIEMPPFLGWLMPIVSIGDLIVAVGIFLLVFLAVRSSSSQS